VDKTCKSSGAIRVAIFGMFSGARVRNTWVIFPEVWNNSEKSELIPDAMSKKHFLAIKVGDRKA
jgi:hypothetical protein